jgi:hypothetical protein
MQSCTCILSALTLSTSIAFGAAAVAADLPKSGNYNLEFNGYGTFSVTMIGKERGLATWDENGAWRGNNGGFGDHMTFHCSGRNNIVSGKAQISGNCIGLDTGGDQLVFDVTGTFVPGTPDPVPVDIKLTTGTGKYEKISGGGPGVCHFGEFKTAVEGTYVNCCTDTGGYKLP